MRDRKVLCFVIAAVVSVSVLIAVVVGCGGGGGGSSTPGSSSVAGGKIVLPPGFKIPLKNLIVSSSAAEVSPSANGSFSISMGEVGPAMIQAYDKTSGKLVMLGYADASPSGSAFANGQGVISSNTTANALIFFGTGCFSMPNADWELMRELITPSSQEASVGALVAARLAINPTAITDGDSQIQAAIQQIQSTVTNSRIMAERQSGPRLIAAVAVRPATSSGAPPLINVSPSGQQSGVEVTPAAEVGGIVFINHFRRRCSAFIYKVADVDSSGNRTLINPPQEMTFPSNGGQPTTGFPLDPAIALNGTLGTLTAAFQGQFAWQPTTSSAVDLTADQGSAETLYDVVVVGTSIHSVADSASAEAVSNGNAKEFAYLNTEWGNEQTADNIQSLVIDLFAPLIFNFVPTDTEVKDELGKRNSTLAADLGGILSALPDVNASLKKNDLKGAISGALSSFADSTEIKQQVLQVLMKATWNTLSFNAAADISLAMERVYKANTVIDAIDTALAGVDILGVLYDLAHSNPDELWNVTVLPAKVTILPQKSTVDVENSVVNLSVVIQNEPDLSKFRFQWSTTGLEGSLEKANSTTPLPTTPIPDTSIAYVADLLKLKVGTVDKVTVNVFLATDLTTQVGTATATVTGAEPPPCGPIPPPIAGPTGPGMLTLTLDKSVYKTGDIMTMKVTVAPGDTGQQATLIFMAGGVGQPSFNAPATLLTIDGKPSDQGVGQIEIPTLHPGAGESHVLTFQMNQPQNELGDPATYCAGGDVNSRVSGPYVTVSREETDNLSLGPYVFFDETP